MNGEIKLFTPAEWEAYELIDSGNFEKLERFGSQVLIRPEPQALWDKSLSEEIWAKRATAVFRKLANDPEKGKWTLQTGAREQWAIPYTYGDMRFKLRLGLTGFRHIGAFPEQAVNWNFIYDELKKNSSPEPKVLNLFAYTGGASLAARAAGADVVHVDSVKPVLSWARENMELSGFDCIRWMLEDALKFVRREVRRGNRYQGIIMDPPAYGRGPDGEKWLLETHLNEIVSLSSRLLEPEKSFFILNLYSMGFSPLVGQNLIRQAFTHIKSPEAGELYLEDSFGKRLPLGTVVRFAITRTASN